MATGMGRFVGVAVPRCAAPTVRDLPRAAEDVSALRDLLGEAFVGDLC
ncbi:MAG: hypothetical protein ACR2JU_03835 [Nocardioidaceae bacterium]